MSRRRWTRSRRASRDAWSDVSRENAPDENSRLRKKGVDYYYSRNTISFVRYNHWGSSAAPSSDARRDHLWILAAVTVMTAATTPPANPNPTSATAAPRLPDAENAFAAA